MGLFDRFFSKEKSEERFVKRQVARLMNKYGQREVREDAMTSLAQRGTPAAIKGLLQRFTYTHPESIIDESEKHRAIELLQALGSEVSSGPLREFLQKNPQVSMALIAYERLEGEEGTCQLISELLQEAEPDNTWDSDRKLQLINHLDSYSDKSMLPAILPFLQDVNDDVVFRVIDLLERLGGDDIRQACTEVLLNEETSARIRVRLLDLARGRKWYLGPHREKLEPLLPEGYYFDKRDNVKQRERH